MPDKKTYEWSFQLSKKTWIIGGMPCSDCVDESNYEAWKQYLSKQISKLLSANTIQTKEFQEELEAVRKNEEERLAHQKKQDEAAEVRRRRSCMERPKIDYVPKGLHIDLEEVYAKYFQQEVTFFPEDKDDFMYMLRLLERWEKKSIPAVLAKGRPDAAYAIAMGLCEHLPLLIMRGDIEDYLSEYKLRIGKLIYASFSALVDSVKAWNNEEKRKQVLTYFKTQLPMFGDYKQVLKKLQILAPITPFIGETVAIEREMNSEEERAVREAERRRLEKERQILEAEKEARSLIPLNKDYEEHIFKHRYVDWDCYSIWQLMLEENKNIEQLLATGKYQTAALMFLQLTKSMCRHFVIDRHWEYFDDMYNPEYAIEDLIEKFRKLVKQGKLPESVKTYLHEAWKEIEEMESCTDYGVPRRELPF